MSVPPREQDRYLPGELEGGQILTFLSECEAAFPVVLSSVDLGRWTTKLRAYADAFCLCRANGSLAAALFVYLNDTRTHVGYVSFLAALPDCEKGIAYRLHEACRGVALQHGMTKLRLEVHKDNAHALAFYRRQGYVIAGDHEECRKWLMELDLTSDK